MAEASPPAWSPKGADAAALNDDLSFNQFVQQQIAGDELWPDDPQAAIATGFLMLSVALVTVFYFINRKKT